jgi:hypothetical protein
VLSHYGCQVLTNNVKETQLLLRALGDVSFEAMHSDFAQCWSIPANACDQGNMQLLKLIFSMESNNSVLPYFSEEDVSGNVINTLLHIELKKPNPSLEVVKLFSAHARHLSGNQKTTSAQRRGSLVGRNNPDADLQPTKESKRPRRVSTFVDILREKPSGLRLGQEFEMKDEENTLYEVRRCLVNFSQKNLQGDAPIHLATLNPHGSQTDTLAMVKLILDEMEDLNLVDAEGRTAMHCAAETNLVEVVDFLLSRRCSAQSQNARGETPLHIGAMRGHWCVGVCGVVCVHVVS